MKTLRIAMYVVMSALVITVVLFLYYNLPRTYVVQIIGTSVKRSNNNDIRFITVLTRGGKMQMYRNEDTGWGWPPYFKFNSANLSGQARVFASEAKKPWVLITYYGWRVTVLSLFPNVIALKKVDKNYNHLPLFNIFFLLSLAVAIFFAARGVRRMRSSLHGTRGDS